VLPDRGDIAGEHAEHHAQLMARETAALWVHPFAALLYLELVRRGA